MIKAMKGNLEGNFSQRAWDLGNPEKHGWVKVGVKSEAATVESQKIDIVDVATDEDLYPTDDEMRAELTAKGIKFHPKTGRTKLKIKYDESKK